MKKLYIKIALAASLIFLFGSSLYSEDCPDEGGSWATQSVDVDLGYYGDQGSVDFKYKDIPGEYKIKMDWSTLVNNSDFVTDDILKKMLEWEAVEKVVLNESIGIHYVAVYYQSECKQERKCFLELEYDRELLCCDGGGGQQTQQWETWLKDNVSRSILPVTRLVTCGYKCCARIYTVEVKMDASGLNKVAAVIGQPITETISECDCDDCPFYHCWYGNNPPTEVPCEGECE